MTTRAAEALHLARQLERWQLAPAVELAGLWPCPRCKAAPGTACRTPGGKLLRSLGQRRAWEPPHHAERVWRAEQAQRSGRLDALLRTLSEHPALGLARARHCALFRRLDRVDALVPWQPPARLTAGELARVGGTLLFALRTRTRLPEPDSAPLNAEQLAIVRTVNMRRSLGLPDMHQGAVC